MHISTSKRDIAHFIGSKLHSRLILRAYQNGQMHPTVNGYGHKTVKRIKRLSVIRK